MKKIFIFIIIVAGLCWVLNTEVTTRQGVNYHVSVIKIPLYLKVLDFYDRHFNYKWVAHKIISNKATDDEKVLAIFNWTVENINRQPNELPAIDDHVWHIIVRGYGTRDQFSDVFTTLCSYAGFEAFFDRLPNREGTSVVVISFVKIKKLWYVFDPYNGILFVSKDGRFSSLQDIQNNDWRAKGMEGVDVGSNVSYQDYFNNLSSLDPQSCYKWSRASIQSPVKRLLYAIRRQKIFQFRCYSH